MHPAWTYTLRDVAGASWGVLVFASALLAPGFCIGRLVNPFCFRDRGLREQMAWSVALSFGPGILLLTGVVGLGGATAGAVFLFSVTAAAVWMTRGHWPVPDISRQHCLIAGGVLLAWVCIVLGSTVEIGTHGRLWMSVTSYDHGLRTTFVEAVLRTGVPPVDPVYWPGHDAPMRYYYFWYAVCASVARMAHITSRQVLIASCVWPLPGVVAMLALFGRYVLGHRGRELTRLIVISASLLAVAGLDLLVTAALRLLHTPVLPDMEWWSIDQVASWLDTFLWVPHHAAALVAALLGLLLLLASSSGDEVAERADPPVWRRRDSIVAALAGASFAAAFGMSSYLGVASAILAVGWLLLSWRRDQGRRALISLCIAALVATVSLSRFLWQLTRRDGASPSSASALYVGLREILNPVVMAHSPLFHSLAARHPLRARELAAGILLLPGWGVELGFYAVVLLVALKRWRHYAPAERTLLWLTFCGLVGSSVLRSGVIATNDYGIRAALFPQFFLLLLGALVLASAAGAFRRFLWLLLAIGASGCVYQLILLRTYLPWQQAHGNPELRDVGERTYALHEAYAALGERVVTGARLQFDPAATSFFLYPHLLYANRQMITAEIACITSFGGDPAPCPRLQNDIVQLFPADAPLTPDAEGAERLCAAIGAQYLVATRWDAAWQQPSGWVWTLPAVVEQPAARVVDCTAAEKL